jgi:formate hydrogenlyase transcriptional activator
MASAAHQFRPVPAESAETSSKFDEEDIDLREQVLSAPLFGEIVGSSEAIRRVTAQVLRVAPSEATVLITGESGTGKELIARAIHRGSSRSRLPLVCMNCAATPPALIATDLFGHERGAFTGAVTQTMGRFQQADNGTLFLDEIGDLQLDRECDKCETAERRHCRRLC